MHGRALQFILMWERRDEREIKKLNESKKRMIKDLKVG